MSEELLTDAGVQLAKLLPYATLQRELTKARDLVVQQAYRAVGPHRAARNVERLQVLVKTARTLLPG